ncbi:MAG: hypothetical protein M0Q24_05230 [Sulfurimonas sp.]|uniref:hypothetical protein n=1 Tax=Sulfurimonas sp. TaxID=2022749 RepID=UPI0025CD01B1|nr:hypothetical protein [Sulfurimonas sp.]MCK9491472.1 hypothetical protein [Sulfurimonas sp.]
MARDKEKGDISNQGDLSKMGNVEHIKEILFGSQERELNLRFERLEREMKSMHEELSKRLDQNQRDLNSRINHEFETLSTKIKSIIIKQQDELEDVRDSASKQEKRIQNSLDIISEEFNTKNEQLRSIQQDNKDSLGLDIKNIKDELFFTLQERLSDLDEDKLDKADIANILIEAAMRIKGTRLEQQLTDIDG